MLRAAVWTGGLFAVGAGIVQTFPGPWIEPVVLAGLGLALILAGGRKAAQASRSGADAGGASLDAAERAAR